MKLNPLLQNSQVTGTSTQLSLPSLHFLLVLLITGQPASTGFLAMSLVLSSRDLQYIKQHNRLTTVL